MAECQLTRGSTPLLVEWPTCAVTMLSLHGKRGKREWSLHNTSGGLRSTQAAPPHGGLRWASKLLRGKGGALSWRDAAKGARWPSAKVVPRDWVVLTARCFCFAACVR